MLRASRGAQPGTPRLLREMIWRERIIGLEIVCAAGVVKVFAVIAGSLRNAHGEIQNAIE